MRSLTISPSAFLVVHVGQIFGLSTLGNSLFEPSSGRVYISRDVVFDETIFPFSEIHPNAGARLRQEILLSQLIF
jgi:hypothetical protein